jgi:hypothetical protein
MDFLQGADRMAQIKTCKLVNNIAASNMFPNLIDITNISHRKLNLIS